MIDELLPLIGGRLALEVHDIDSNPEWTRQYGLRIPVLEFEGRTICEIQLDQRAVRGLLDDLIDDARA